MNTTTNPTQPTDLTALARECALRVSNYMAHCGHYVHGANSIESIIAATLRPAVEERDRLKAERESDFEIFHAIRMKLTEACGNPYLLHDEALDAIIAERDQLRADLEQKMAVIKIRQEQLAQYAAALETAEEALKEIGNIRWGWDGDCGAERIADQALTHIAELKKDTL